MVGESNAGMKQEPGIDALPMFVDDRIGDNPLESIWTCQATTRTKATSTGVDPSWFGNSLPVGASLLKIVSLVHMIYSGFA